MPIIPLLFFLLAFVWQAANGLLPMPRSRINGNFIDKTFSIVANILLRIIPTTSGEKEAFTYYRDGVI
ncbi:hypothetical protein RIF29_45394 [Crotalaria pallida]|uniref:Uncharacterized protein n=1 Tax=Crotalaria pallida TaxID=3830 RepID=A0AAN9DTZ6_CROPI